MAASGKEVTIEQSLGRRNAAPPKVPVPDIAKLVARTQRMREALETMSQEDKELISAWNVRAIAILDKDNPSLSDLDKIGENPMLKLIRERG